MSHYIVPKRYTVETIVSKGGELLKSPELSQFSTLEEAKEARLKPFLALAHERKSEPKVNTWSESLDCVGCTIVEASFQIGKTAYALNIYPPAPCQVFYRGQTILMSEDMMQECGFEDGQTLDEDAHYLFLKQNHKRILAKYIE